MIVTFLGGSWKLTPNDGDIYVGEDIRLFCNNMLLGTLRGGWLQWSFTITVKAIFVGNTIVGVAIENYDYWYKERFSCIVNINNLWYGLSMRGYCYLHLTLERIGRTKHSMAHVSEHISIYGTTVPSFRSSSRSNRLSEPLPTIMTQFQYTNQVNYMVPPRFHSLCSAPL